MQDETLTIDPEHLQRGSSVSPFLPGTKVQYAWDSTSLGYLKTCPRLYAYIMIEGWQSRGDSPHLRFGSEYHSALQHYDQLMAQGAKHADAVHAVVVATLERVADWNPDPATKAGKYKNRATLLELVCNYLEHYRDDHAKTFILPDGKAAVELSFRFELPWGPTPAPSMEAAMEGNVSGQPYMLSGHLDRVVDWNDSLFVLDHKTAMSTISDYYFKQYDLSNQMTLYTLAGRIVLKTPVRGVLISAAQIMLEDHNRFVRGVTYRTEAQLDEWQSDLHYWFTLAETYATQGYWPMNDTSCDKFGGCKFREVCSKAPHVRKHYLASDFTKLEEADRWNPLKSR